MAPPSDHTHVVGARAGPGSKRAAWWQHGGSMAWGQCAGDVPYQNLPEIILQSCRHRVSDCQSMVSPTFVWRWARQAGTCTQSHGGGAMVVGP